MGVRGLVSGAAALAGLASTAFAQVPAVVPAAPAPDYRSDANWLCRPGKDALCETGLDAARISASGKTVETFQAAAAPKVDCFYVYPTVSKDPTTLSDLNPGPEEFGVVKAQAARFSGRCRVFAPLYRQVTLSALNQPSAGGGGAIDWSPAYADVLAAWKSYLARDNGGRGVLLIGHSQGSIHLARLIKEEIEGKPIQRQVIAAYLAGHPQITTAVGADVGGTFQSTPLCRSKTQTGCVIAWSSYDASAMPSYRIFERAPDPGLQAVCVNPAALGGGKAPLSGYFSRPKAAPETDPPFVHDVGGYAGECVSDEKGSVLEVSVTPGPYAEARQALLTAVSGRSPPWGLHGLDVSLTEGDLLSLADSQIAAYLAKGR